MIEVASPAISFPTRMFGTGRAVCWLWPGALSAGVRRSSRVPCDSCLPFMLIIEAVGTSLLAALLRRLKGMIGSRGERMLYLGCAGVGPRSSEGPRLTRSRGFDPRWKCAPSFPARTPPLDGKYRPDQWGRRHWPPRWPMRAPPPVQIGIKARGAPPRPPSGVAGLLRRGEVSMRVFIAVGLDSPRAHLQK